MARKLGQKKLDKFKDLFLKQKQEILNNIQKNSEEELDIDGDEVDIVQGNFISEIQNRISSRDLERLTKLNNALNKIENGEFGLCEECEKQIPEKRLIAMPACSTCVNCAEELENLSKQYIA